jgi:GH15 family glucan-1,4-alpha-glucosidase
MFLLLHILAPCAEDADGRLEFPGYTVNNWNASNELVIFFYSPSQPIGITDVRQPGLYANGLGYHQDKTIMTDDSFSLKLDDKIYGDTEKLSSNHNGGLTFSLDGKVTFEFTKYDGEDLPVKITKNIILPPLKKFYVVQYIIENTDSSQHTVTLLDHIRRDSVCNSGLSDMSTILDNYAYFVEKGMLSSSVTIDKTHTVTASFSTGVAGDDRLFEKFKKDGTIGNPDRNWGGCSVAPKVMFGAQYTFDIPPHESKTVTSYRCFSGDHNSIKTDTEELLATTSDSWFTYTADKYAKWLASGKKTRLSGDSLELYQKCLLTMKNAQRPSNGVIDSCLDPLYGHKVWVRELMYTIMALDSAGYEAEAEKALGVLESLPNFEFDGTQAPICTTVQYDYPDQRADHVDPQSDTVGMYIFLMNYHLSVRATSTQWSPDKGKWEHYFNHLADGYAGGFLVRSDYSPWEESSHQLTGAGMKLEYGAYAQAWAHAGILAYKKLGLTNQQLTINETKAERIENATKKVLETLWNTEEKYFNRGFEDRKFDESYNPKILTMYDASSLAAIFTGLVTGNRARQHLDRIKYNLTHTPYGLSRHNDDEHFHNSQYNPRGAQNPETTENEPAWIITTAFAAWAEQALGLDFQGRIDYIESARFYGNTPGGSAVDWATGKPVVFTAPHVGQFAALYVYTVLLSEQKTLFILDSLAVKPSAS